VRDQSLASHEVLSILEHDDKHILIIEYPWSRINNYWADNRSKYSIISKLNVYTGQKTKIESIPHKGARVLAGKNGEVNFTSWFDKGGEYHSAFRKNQQSGWQELKTLLDFEENPSPVAIDSQSEKAYLVGAAGPQKLNTMYELDLSTGETKQLFSGLQSDLEAWETNAESFKPEVGISYPNTTQYHYPNHDSPFIKTHKNLVKAFKGKNMFITSQTRDGRLWLVNVSSDINPGEFYLYNTQSHKA